MELDWLRRADLQPSGLSSRVFAQRTTLADDGASWQSTGVELLDVPPDAECRYRPPSTLQRAGDRTVLACVDSQLLVRDAQGVAPLAFSPAAPEPYFSSDAQVAVASDRAGSVFIAYIDALTHALHVGHLDAAQQLTLAHGSRREDEHLGDPARDPDGRPGVDARWPGGVVARPRERSRRALGARRNAAREPRLARSGHAAARPRDRRPPGPALARRRARLSAASCAVDRERVASRRG